MRSQRNRASLGAVLSLLVLFTGVLAAPASAVPVTARVAATGAPAAPAPPPAPIGPDGVRMQGSWSGPYTYRNYHSGKCLDMSGTAEGAAAVQRQCLAGYTSQAWYEWFYMGDGSIAYFLLSNGFTGQCITGIHGRGVALWQQPCYEVEHQTWIRTVANLNQYTNEMTSLCMEVGGWATHDGAIVMSWDCLGNPNQLWSKFGWH